MRNVTTLFLTPAHFSLFFTSLQSVIQMDETCSIDPVSDALLTPSTRIEDFWTEEPLDDRVSPGIFSLQREHIRYLIPQ